MQLEIRRDQDIVPHVYLQEWDYFSVFTVDLEPDSLGQYPVHIYIYMKLQLQQVNIGDSSSAI